ncbi:uncharacterized protein LOC119742038 [Patiria miniata]|uniref:V(D)J recombination-activating protein 1 RNase H domain-containing protein n=1 Tax=Patiria miniata TaxID=46514 RepID=A0A914BDB1_PATMI|nr:uncharacterized protein LOC119742038 [Patiria miniata]
MLDEPFLKVTPKDKAKLMVDTSSLTVVEALNLSSVSSLGSPDNRRDQETQCDCPNLAPLDEVGPRQQFRRTNSLLHDLREEAEENGISATELMGYLLHKENYISNRKTADVGLKLFNKSLVDKEMSVDKGLYILSSYNIGRTGYTNLRRDLNEHVTLPAHYKLMEKKNSITPELKPYSIDDNEGITASLKESCSIHVKRLIEAHPEIQPGQYRVLCKDGLDGSGRHSIYHQKGPAQTYSMILYMWILLEVIKEAGSSGESSSGEGSSQASGLTVWKESAANSPEAAVPLFLVKGKEDRELLKSIIPPIEAEKTALSTTGIEINISGASYHFRFEFNLTMVDGKMVKLLTGRGGAYCILCPASRDECHNLDRIDEGFPIGEVSNEDLRKLYQDLQDEGEIKPKPGDYAE